MARNYETTLAELESLKTELTEVQAMTDEQARYIYNVDSKSDIVNEMKEEIEYLEKEVERLIPMDWSADPVTEVFGTYEAMNNFLY